MLSILKGRAIIDYFGDKRELSSGFENIKPGDYVVAQGGIVIETVPEDAAKEILEAWREAFFRLKSADEALLLKNSGNEASAETKTIIEAALSGKTLSKTDVQTLLASPAADLAFICSAANTLRAREQGNSACVHGIIEFSNFCASSCAYCGINAANPGLKRYRMEPKEIIEHTVDVSKRLGFKAIVLQSGEDDSYDAKTLSHIAKKILKQTPMLLIMSIGERPIELYRELYASGVRGALIRFETSNKSRYSKLHNSPLEERVSLIKELKKMGYAVITGSLAGLPGETADDSAEDILLSASLSPEMHSMGPFIAHRDTPLKDAASISLETYLKETAVLRLLDPKKSILVPSAFETLYGFDAVKTALLSGANSMMINLTPKEYGGLYSIYPGKQHYEEVSADVERKLSLLNELGRAPTDIGIKV